MNSSFTLKSAIAEVLSSLSDSFAAFMPRARTALVVFVVGLLVAKLAARLIRTSFSRLKIDDLLERFGLTDLLHKLGLRDTPGASRTRFLPLAKALYGGKALRLFFPQVTDVRFRRDLSEEVERDDDYWRGSRMLWVAGRGHLNWLGHLRFR